MSLLKLKGNPAGGGLVTVQSPASTVDRTLTLPDATGNLPAVGYFPFVTLSGTEHRLTGIPTGVRRIKLAGHGISTNGGDALILQAGPGTTEEGSGYNASTTAIGNATVGSLFSPGSAWPITSSTAAANFTAFSLELLRLNSAGTLWVCSGTAWQAGNQYVIAGYKTLAGELAMLRLTTSAAANVFDAGVITGHYEW